MCIFFYIQRFLFFFYFFLSVFFFCWLHTWRSLCVNYIPFCNVGQTFESLFPYCGHELHPYKHSHLSVNQPFSLCEMSHVRQEKNEHFQRDRHLYEEISISSYCFTMPVSQGGVPVPWLALSPNSRKVLGLIFGAEFACSLRAYVGSLRVLQLPATVKRHAY